MLNDTGQRRSDMPKILFAVHKRMHLKLAEKEFDLCVLLPHPSTLRLVKASGNFEQKCTTMKCHMLFKKTNASCNWENICSTN